MNENNELLYVFLITKPCSHSIINDGVRSTFSNKLCKFYFFGKASWIACCAHNSLEIIIYLVLLVLNFLTLNLLACLLSSITLHMMSILHSLLLLLVLNLIHLVLIDHFTC
uniref:Uncharacterized protein n=1 Tax=Rhizophora mucronata TaxID=61149 RepID=A0A2P2MCB4_RHIMU